MLVPTLYITMTTKGPFFWPLAPHLSHREVGYKKKTMDI